MVRGYAVDGNTLLIKCPRCGTMNRVPAHRVNQKPVCGKCRSSLSSALIGDQPVTVGDGTFTREVHDSPLPVLLDCWAPWCGPCRNVAPVLDELARQYAGRLKIAKLNVDENPQTASQFQIRSIPTMLFFKNGQLVDQVVGALPKGEIEARIKKFI